MGTPYDLVIVGAGAAGSEAAFSVADGGRTRILLVESAHFGGTCTNWGCVPTKALVRAAKIAHLVRLAGDFGVRLAREPRIDWPAVIGRAYRVRDHMLHLGGQPFVDAGVEVRFPARAVLTGQHRLAVDGEELEASAVLIAAGMRSAAPPIPGLEETGFLDNEGALRLAELPRRLAVIGSGPIGAEFAQIFARLGVKVTVLEALPQMLPAEEPESGAALLDAFVAEGIEVRTSANITGVARRRGSSVKRIELGSGPPVDVDEILVATGRRFDGDALGLDAAGIAWTPQGVKVDACLRTSRPWAWAAGDAVGGPLFTHVANAMGPAAARNALRGGSEEVDLRVLPRVTFTDPEVASVGLTEAQARRAGHQIRVGFAALAEAEKAQIDGQRFGHVKVVADGDGQLLGCAIVSETAADMIHEAVAIMAGRVSVGVAGRAIHAYPTLSQLLRSALQGAD